jgi:hypothetical protein
MSPRTLAVAGALLTALAVPAGARAAVIDPPLKPCYVTVGEAPGEQESVTFRASGFTPNSRVDLVLDGLPVPGGVALQTDANGALGALTALSIPAPYLAAGSRDFTISLTEQGNPASTATATAKTTALGITVEPQSAKPSSRIHFRGNGFTGRNRVYAHYLYRGKLRKTVRMAKPKGPCGSWKAHKRQIPVPNPGTGRWIVQFDQLKRYVEPPAIPSVYVRLTIRVRRVFHGG